MKVINGKKSTLVFQLDSGTVLRVKPGEISNPFIGTIALVRSITSSGKPREIGFVVSNSYELNMIKDLPMISQYYYASEEEAKAAILEGKEFAPAELDPNERKITELESALKTAREELETLKENASKPSSENSELIVALRKELDDKASEINALNSRISDLSAQAEEKTAAIQSLNEKLADVQARYEKSSADLLEANNKLKDAVTAPVEEKRNANGQTLEEVTDLFDKLRTQAKEELDSRDAKIAELSAKIEEFSNVESNAIPKKEFDDAIAAKNAEIEQLKADGAKIVEGYQKAKAACQEIMQKFGIAYVDGQYVKQVDPQ